jgi:hypothetical protein
LRRRKSSECQKFPAPPSVRFDACSFQNEKGKIFCLTAGMLSKNLALVTSPPHVTLVVIEMKNQTPCSDYVETSGIIFFARLVDKIRLHAQGALPAGYNLGFSDPTSFDARFCRFWAVDYDRLAAKTLEGGTNEELLRWCFEGRNFPNEEQILVWNSFIIKRGWRDNGASGLIVEKELGGFVDRDDIQTYVDLHDAEEGRPPKFVSEPTDTSAGAGRNAQCR